MFKKFIITLTLILGMTSVVAFAATTADSANTTASGSSNVSTQEPYSIMKIIAKKLFSQLDNSKAKIQQDPNYLKTIVREDLLPYVQVKYAGALVLGKYYQQATPQELTAYYKAFADYLIQAYAQALTLYHGQKYYIVPPTNQNANFQAVRINLISSNGQAPIPLDFQWRKNTQTGQWQAYDMVANGISMITTKQNEWADVLKQKGITQLTQILEKAAEHPITLGKTK